MADERTITSEMVHKAFRNHIRLFPHKDVTLSCIRSLLETNECLNGILRESGKPPITILQEMLLGD
jgi:hypothetical protein